MRRLTVTEKKGAGSLKRSGAGRYQLTHPYLLNFINIFSLLWRSDYFENLTILFICAANQY